MNNYEKRLQPETGRRIFSEKDKAFPLWTHMKPTHNNERVWLTISQYSEEYGLFFSLPCKTRSSLWFFHGSIKQLELLLWMQHTDKPHSLCNKCHITSWMGRVYLLLWTDSSQHNLFWSRYLNPAGFSTDRFKLNLHLRRRSASLRVNRWGQTGHTCWELTFGTHLSPPLIAPTSQSLCLF